MQAEIASVTVALGTMNNDEPGARDRQRRSDSSVDGVARTVHLSFTDSDDRGWSRRIDDTPCKVLLRPGAHDGPRGAMPLASARRVWFRADAAGLRVGRRRPRCRLVRCVMSRSPNLAPRCPTLPAQGGRRAFGLGFVCLAALSQWACTEPPAETLARTLEPPNGACSDITRAVARAQGREFEACGTFPFRSLTPVGRGFMLGWTPATGDAELWELSADASFEPGPLAAWVFNGIRNNHLLVRLGDRYVLDYDQRSAAMNVWILDSKVRGIADPIKAQHGEQHQWPKASGGRGVLALDQTRLLEWQPGNGAYGVMEYREDDPLTPFLPFSNLGAKDAFLRGHRLLSLGHGRLLEWEPRTQRYRIWQYDLERLPEDVFDEAPIVESRWPMLGQEHEILLLDEHVIGIWSRLEGTIEARAFDPLSSDPLAGETLNVSRDDRFRSIVPATERATSSNIRRLVIVFQQGRSFDSYFGAYCRATPGSEPACTEGPSCCEAMPALVDGVGCRTMDGENDDHVPKGSASCLVEKMESWAVGELTPPSRCGDARDFACTKVGAEAGPVGAYHALVAEGALADRYFASVADTWEPNLIHFATTRSVVSNIQSTDTDWIGLLLANAGIPFALYLSNPQTDTFGQPVPPYYDGSWSHYRALEELERDVAAEQLPPISIVIPGPGSNEAPGPAGSLSRGVELVSKVVSAIVGSARYEPETLVLVTHLTSGGFYDHVAPPTASAEGSAQGRTAYGPRVPFLALGRFARKNTVSHALLDHASLTAFIEWNWFDGKTGQLRGRDGVVDNLGSLLDPNATGEPVPSER